LHVIYRSVFRSPFQSFRANHSAFHWCSSTLQVCSSINLTCPNEVHKPEKQDAQGPHRSPESTWPIFPI
jgi:hypothetical protein